MFKAAEGRQYIRQQRPAEQQAAEGRQYIRQHRASSTSGSRGPAAHQAAEGWQYIRQPHPLPTARVGGGGGGGRDELTRLPRLNQFPANPLALSLSCRSN